MPSTRKKNRPVLGGKNFAPRSAGETRMVINAMDYKQTQNPLTCTIDAGNMKELAESCCISDLSVMLNEECTKENVEAKIRRWAQDVCLTMFLCTTTLAMAQTSKT